MKVSLIGGTGFVGSHLVPALLEAGHVPRLLIHRSESGRGLPLDGCEIVRGAVADQAAVAECVAGAEAFIYLIGILREFPSRGITFEGLQWRGVERTLQACQASGCGRFLLMSANGVKPVGTPYQSTKFQAEEAVKASGLRWTIFRPSVIYGQPNGRMEFCSQLRRDIVDSPLPAPLFYSGLLPREAGGFKLAPVAVEDVVQAFVRALERPETEGRTLHLCGPEASSWKEILETIAAAVGKRKWMLPAPVLGVKVAASLFDRQPWFPITRDQITMLLEGNVCEDMSAYSLLGMTPRVFDAASLAYLRAG